MKRFLILAGFVMLLTQCGFERKLLNKDKHDKDDDRAFCDDSFQNVKSPTLRGSINKDYYIVNLNLNGPCGRGVACNHGHHDDDRDDPESDSPQLKFTGGSVGNGGYSVVCKDTSGDIISNEVLDYYEARVLRNTTIDFGVTSTSGYNYAKRAIDRLKAIDPTRASIYQKRLDQFESQAQFLDTGIELRDVADSLNVVLPENCALYQTIIQRNTQERFPGDKEFLVNSDIWNASDPISQAGLMLHEIIYEEAIAFGAKNSVNVRYFNGNLSSSTFASLDLSSYKKLLGIVRFPGLELANGLVFNLGSVKYYPGTANPQSGALAFDYIWPLTYHGNRVMAIVDGGLPPNIQIKDIDDFSGLTVMQFYPNGEIKNVTTADGEGLGLMTTDDECVGLDKNMGLSIDQNGNISN